MYDLFIIHEGCRPVLVSGRHPRATLGRAIADARESNRLDREHGWKPQRHAVVDRTTGQPVCYVEIDGEVTGPDGKRARS